MRIKSFIIITLLLILFVIQVSSILDRTYFTYLGLPITATKDDIEEAYKTKKQKIQGLQNQQEKQMKLKLLQTAYNTLSNNKQRQKYERYGKDIMKHVTTITSKDAMGETDTRKGKALILEVPLSIQDVYKGTTLNTQFFRKTACSKCKGTGAASPKAFPICTRCQGKGFSVKKFQNMWGQMETVQQNCPLCQGQGRTVNKLCDQCNGKKIHTKLQTLSVKISPFISEDSQIIIPNFGDQQQLGAPSDLKLKIVQIPTEKWQRKGKLNLIYKFKISLLESITGFTKSFTHLNGQEIKIEKRELTRPDNEMTFKQKGFPDQKTNKKGDLIVKFIIQMPSFTDNQLDQWQQFFKRHSL